MATHLLRPGARVSVWLLSAVLMVVIAVALPSSEDVIKKVVDGLATLAPVIAVAALLAGWLAVSRFASSVRLMLSGGSARAVIIGSAAGALTPVCGLGVLPLIAALQRQGVVLPAIMAFWLSSPVTDPAMLVVTAGVLGLPFAIAKTIAAFAMGIFAGILTALLRMPAGQVDGAALSAARCFPGAASCDSHRRRRFLKESLANGELALRWLTLALILEVLVQSWVPEQWIESTVGMGGWWDVPIAATVGAPLYFDGFAALPLVRGFVELGMSAGAALAMLIAGSAVSLYSAVAVFSLVPMRVFLLYITAAVTGAILCGYVAQLLGLEVTV